MKGKLFINFKKITQSILKSRFMFYCLNGQAFSIAMYVYLIQIQRLGSIRALYCLPSWKVSDNPYKLGVPFVGHRQTE